MYKTSSFSALLFVVILAVGLVPAYALYTPGSIPAGSAAVLALAFAVGIIVAIAVKIASPWDKAVVVRLGRFRALRGPGVFFIIPVVDTFGNGTSTPATVTGRRTSSRECGRDPASDLAP